MADNDNYEIVTSRLDLLHNSRILKSLRYSGYDTGTIGYYPAVRKEQHEQALLDLWEGGKGGWADAVELEVKSAGLDRIDVFEKYPVILVGRNIKRENDFMSDAYLAEVDARFPIQNSTKLERILEAHGDPKNIEEFMPPTKITDEAVQIILAEILYESAQAGRWQHIVLSVGEIQQLSTDSFKFTSSDYVRKVNSPQNIRPGSPFSDLRQAQNEGLILPRVFRDFVLLAPGPKLAEYIATVGK